MTDLREATCPKCGGGPVRLIGDIDRLRMYRCEGCGENLSELREVKE